MKIFFKIISFLFVLFVLSCSNQNIYLFPIKYKLPSQTFMQELKIKISRKDGEKSLNAKLWYKKNKIRIEVMDDQNKFKRVIIIINKILYYIDENSKTAYRCDIFSDYATNFLSNIFVNAGIGKSKERFVGTDKLNNQDCFIYTYNIFVQYENFYCPAYIKEFRNQKNDTVIQIIAEIKPYTLNESEKVIKTLEIISTKNKFFLTDDLFKIKKDLKIIELNSLRK